MQNILVAEKLLTGRFCGYYRIYDKANPIKTLSHIHYLHLPDFLDSCVIDPINQISWDACEVINPGEKYTVEFDLDFRKELAKEILAKLYAVNTAVPACVADDIISETESRITDCLNYDDPDGAIEDILHDYLGLDASYSWIFM